MREQELNKIKAYNRRMGKLQKRYEDIKGNSMVPGKEIKEVMCQSSGSKDSIYIRNAEEAYDIESEYRMLYWKADSLIREARKYINSLPDATLRMVLELTYINNMDGYEVAVAAGLKEKECERILFVHFNNVF